MFLQFRKLILLLVQVIFSYEKDMVYYVGHPFHYFTHKNVYYNSNYIPFFTFTTGC
jgi:hypothetical protein